MTIQTEVFDQGDQLIVQRTERFDGLLDTCKAMHNEGLHGSSDLRLYGHVPAVLVEDYCNREGVAFAEFMGSQDHIKRFLNDPALAHFRIWKGRV